MTESDILVKLFQWDDVLKYYDKIVNMQLENVKKFHYPDKQISATYIKTKINELRKHLENDNTYFIGVVRNDKLLGFLWAYESLFIEDKRIQINSMYIIKEARRLGLGKILMDKIEAIANDKKCNSIATHYATINENAGDFYIAQGFNATRTEVVKRL